jgi:ATP/maltotriose-dependent transcriptional regulator MalT/DNA-binding SARP family transcriptional activator
MPENTTIAKITRPRITGVYQRQRLFKFLDKSRDRPVIWVSGPAGSGKTTLVASYLDARKLPCLWYQVDEGEADIASFFYYMALAAGKAAPRYKKPLPLLTPEYLQDIPTFSKRFFEELYIRLGSLRGSLRNPLPPAAVKGGNRAGLSTKKKRPEFVLVFDDHQTVPSDSVFHDVMSRCLSLLPHGIVCIVVSRRDPPAAYTRLLAGQKLSVVGWDELRFTEQETRAIIRASRKGGVTNSAVKLLYQKTGGWAAGLMLMLHSIRSRDIDEGTLEKVPPERIFDYFASEIFDKIDNETQDFLLKTSCLPQMDPQVVERFTGTAHANRILSDLARNHFFTIKSHKENAYQYHALFREFLLKLAENKLTRDEINDIRRKAASLLEEAGQAEDAAVLFCEAEDWNGYVQLILKQAPTLVAQGRGSTLEKWLSSAPKEISDQVPWLMFWRGVCTMPFSPAQARHDFGRAFELFSSMQDRAGMFLSWSGAVESSLHEGEFVQLDKRLALLDEVFREDIAFPSPEIEARVAMSVFNALSLRQPHHVEMGRWKQKALALFQHQPDLNINTRLMIGALLVVHCLYTGDMAGAALVIDLLARLSSTEGMSEMVTICVKNTDAFYHLFAGSYQECLRNVYEGMRLADETGVHVWDWHIIGHGVAAALNAGDMERADALFMRFPKIETARRFDKGYYHYLNSWRSLLRGDAAYALEELRLCISLFEAIGFSLLQPVAYAGLAEVLHERGEENEARAYLTKAYEMGVSAKSAFAQYKCLLVHSRFCFEKGDEAEGLDHLRKAMRLGNENGLVNVGCWRRTVMADLCMRALQAGMEVDYVRFLIQKLKLMPELPPVHIDNWPWPLKFYTLGQFKIERDGKQLEFPVKVQKKPLELLKALIAFGGREVSETHLIDTLWPDAEGDAGYRAFITTLQRLRNLLSHKDAIQLQGRHVSLDSRYCWVDTWAFEDITGKSEAAWKENKVPEAIRLTEKAMNLYGGSFLENYFEEDRTVSLRESLRAKFLRSVKRLGRHFEQSGEWEKATESYQRGLDADNLDEELYRALMACYSKMGRTAEVLRVYDRCRKALEKFLGVEPSPETETLYKDLLRNNSRNQGNQ